MLHPYLVVKLLSPCLGKCYQQEQNFKTLVSRMAAEEYYFLPSECASQVKAHRAYPCLEHLVCVV